MSDLSESVIEDVIGGEQIEQTEIEQTEQIGDEQIEQIDKNANTLLAKYAPKGEKMKYKCPKCDYLTTRKNHMKPHMKTHGQTKEHKCHLNWCSFACHQAENLTTHMDQHLQKRKFVCAWDGCEAAFVRKSERKQHIAFHKNDKTHTCPFEDCNFSSVAKASLEIHVRTHTGIKPYKCKEVNCGYSGTTSSGLKSHWLHNHSKEGIQKRKKQEERINRCLLEAGYSDFDEGGDFHPPLKHFKREHFINFQCIDDKSGKNANIDFVIGVNGGLVMLEVDEYQHKYEGYSCDLSRMAKVHETLTLAGSDIPIFWIRYNPNAFRVDGVSQKCKKVDRERWLIDFLSKLDLREFPQMTICYKYYDEENGIPVVAQNEDYPFKHSLFQE